MSNDSIDAYLARRKAEREKSESENQSLQPRKMTKVSIKCALEYFIIFISWLLVVGGIILLVHMPLSFGISLPVISGGLFFMLLSRISITLKKIEARMRYSS